MPSVTSEAYQLAHCLLHFGESHRPNLRQRELEAEATAYVVAHSFGLDLQSNFYLASYGVKAADLLESLPIVSPSVPDGTVINNNASVSSSVADPNNANNSASAAVSVQASADLSISKTSDKGIYKPSSVITYTVAVTNNGPSDSLAVVVTDNLPTTSQAIYKSDTGGCTKSGLILTCNFGNMPVGTSKAFNISELVKGSRGQVSNTASVTSSTADPNTSNNSATRVVTIGH